MLERGDVERLEVANRSVVRVYLRPDSEWAKKAHAPPGMPQYQFQLGSVDNFERRLEDAQKVVSHTPIPWAAHAC